MSNLSYKINKGSDIFEDGIRIISKGDTIVALNIDTKEKGYYICYTGMDKGYPMVGLRKGEDQPVTEILFTDYFDWSVFSEHMGRYTLSVCLYDFENI